MRSWQRDLSRLTDLQQTFFTRLQTVAKLPYETALQHTKNATAEEMRVYLLTDYKTCTCENNGDLCKRCEVYDMLREHQKQIHIRII